jgi:ribonuclease HI
MGKRKKKNRLLAYTDGSTQTNPGIGGYAYVITSWDRKKIIRKFTKHVEDEVTNNQMELLATIEAVDWFLENTNKKYLVLNTDSRYCSEGYNNWMEKWKLNNWKTTKGQVKNLDLWKRLYDLKTKSEGRVIFNWIKGHNGDKFNTMAHNLSYYVWKNKINKLNERKSKTSK